MGAAEARVLSSISNLTDTPIQTLVFGQLYNGGHNQQTQEYVHTPRRPGTFQSIGFPRSNRPRNAEPKSKRGTTRLRHKIEKASVAKQKKERKQAKKNPEWRSRLKKDPGIPNLFPYKERVLQEIEEKKLQKQEETKRRKEAAKAAKTSAVAQDANEDDMVDEGSEGDEFDETMEVDDEEVDESNPMAALLASAKAAADKYDRDLAADDEDMDSEDSDGGVRVYDHIPAGQASSKKAFEKVYKQVVEQSDVVLYVLDARDPEGTRSREIERSIMAASTSGKRLILLLNKIDLVPADVLKAWLAYLRRYFPTLPIRASKPASGAQVFEHGDMTMQGTSAALFKALKAFAASQNLKRAVSVGVIGYPNVGKSSVINALLSRLGGRGASASRACPAGAEAGVTTSIRAVKLDNKLTLLDSPGVIFPSSPLDESAPAAAIPLKTPAEKHAHLVLLNVVPPKQIDDPVPAVTLLLRRLSTQPEFLSAVSTLYDLPALMPDAKGDHTTDFLVQVARRRGRIGRGGVPNISAAAMTVVTDWRDGRIRGWTKPPTDNELKGIAVGGSTGDDLAKDDKVIVSGWAEEFKLDGLWAGDDAMEE